MLVLVGSAGLLAPCFADGVNGMTATLVVTSIIWLMTAATALLVGWAAPEHTHRAVAGIIGLLYVLWGVASLVVVRLAALSDFHRMTSAFIILLGVLGCAAAISPPAWQRAVDA